MKKEHRTYLAGFVKEQDGTYSVHVPALPGCYSQGDTFEEAMENIREAILAYLESQKKDNQPLYDPSQAFAQVEVEA